MCIRDRYYGEGLNGLLSARHFDMQGIVNGIDYNAYDPVSYTHLDVYKRQVLQNTQGGYCGAHHAKVKG